MIRERSKVITVAEDRYNYILYFLNLKKISLNIVLLLIAQ